MFDREAIDNKLQHQLLHYQQDTKKPNQSPSKNYSSSIYIWGNLFPDSQLILPLNELNNNFSPNKIKDSKQDLNTQNECKTYYTFPETIITNVHCGKNHAAFISTKGELYMVGKNESGQLGNGEVNSQFKFIKEPNLLSSLLYKGLIVEYVACGFSHTIAVTNNGKIFSWGLGKYGALGLENFENRNSPTEIVYFSSSYQTAKDIVTLQCGSHHSGLFDKRGNVYLWGAGEVGQLGNVGLQNECTPQNIRLSINDQEKVKQISLGYYHTLILTTSGRVLQTGISSNQMKSTKIDLKHNSFCTFKEIPQLRAFIIETIKAKEISVFMTSKQKLLIQAEYNQVEQINQENIQIDDFELCKDSIIIRNNNNFYKYDLQAKQLKPFQSSNKIFNEFSVLACGHEFIFGVKVTKTESPQEHSDRVHQTFSFVNKIQNNASDTQLFSQGHCSNKSRTHKRDGSMTLPYSNSNQNLGHSLPYELNDDDATTMQDEKMTSHSMINLNEYGLRRNDSPLSYQKGFSLPNQNIELRSQILSTDTQSIPTQQQEAIGQFQRSIHNRNKSDQLSTKQMIEKMKNDANMRYNQTEYLTQISENCSSYQQAAKHLLLSDDKKQQTTENLKEALKIEIKQRLQLESQILYLQKEFDIFKKDVGVDQMKSVIAESQDEYQKLYEICVQECEKAAQFSQMYKKEKKAREERESQIVEMGEEIIFLKGQIKQLEDQLKESRAGKENEKGIIKDTLVSQQKVIQELREHLNNEKERQQKKIKFLEEANNQLEEQFRQKELIYKNYIQLEKQQTADLVNQNNDLKIKVQSQKDQLLRISQRLNISSPPIAEKENDNLKQQVTSLQNIIQTKNIQISEFDKIISQIQDKDDDTTKDTNNYGSLHNQIKHQLGNTQLSRVPSNGRLSQGVLPKKATKVDKNGKALTQLRNQTGSVKKTQQNTTPNVKVQLKKQPQVTQTLQKTVSNKKLNENSPERLQQMIELQDQNTKQFLQDISQIVDTKIYIGSSNEQTQSSLIQIRKFGMENNQNDNNINSQVNSSRVSSKQPLKSLYKQYYRAKQDNSNYQSKHKKNPSMDEKSSLNQSLLNKTPQQKTVNHRFEQNKIYQDYEVLKKQESSQSEKQNLKQGPIQVYSTNSHIQDDYGKTTSWGVKKKQVKFTIDSKQADNDEIDKIYEKLSSEIRQMKGNTDTEQLKESLVNIKRNKLLLEEKIKEYECEIYK